jgi:hypothetical protein
MGRSGVDAGTNLRINPDKNTEMPTKPKKEPTFSRTGLTIKRNLVIDLINNFN